MRHRRKTEHCLNCGLQFARHYHYCPQCGQENTNTNVSFAALMSDLFSNYLTLDSRMGRTMFPFLFQPGLLTVAFNRGQRLLYLHPVRLYILMSLFFFLVVGRVFSPDNISLRKALQGTSKANTAAPPKPKRIATIATTDTANVRADTINIGDDAETFGWLARLITKPDMTEQALLDSLDSPQSRIGFAQGLPRQYRQVFARQALKIGQKDLPLFLLNVLGNIPAMMLLMLPVLALVLQVLYAFSKRNYIEHFIFTLHLQSFVYLVFGIGLMLFAWANSHMAASVINVPQANFSIFFGSHLILFFYHYAMFKRVYGQGFVFTLFKLCAFSLAYLTIFLMAMVIEFLYSFLMF